MSLPISLQAVVDEMDVLDDDWVAYVNRRTGQLVTVTEYDHEESTEALQAESSPDFLALPSEFDIHEYSLIERFSGSVCDSVHRQELLSAIKGHGAFGRFREAARRLDLEEEWYSFRQESLESIASGFLDAHGIPYKRP